jgi:hypothetical protein
VQVHAALRLVRQRPKSRRAAAVEIQFSGVLQAQHNRMGELKSEVVYGGVEAGS